MQNEFLILELGTDLQDSVAFKFGMTQHHRGRDLTPACEYPHTTFGNLTVLNTIPRTSWRDRRIQEWMQAFIHTQPVALYISSHHALNSQGFFWNGKKFGVRFLIHGIQFGDYGTLLAQGKKLHGQSFKENLVMVILDGCNFVSSKTPHSGRKIQEMFAFKGQKPVILGFQNKSPKHGTASLHQKFLELLPIGDILKTYKPGSAKQNELIKWWLEAGRHWQHQSKTNVVGIDNTGRVFEYNGKEMR